jgi:hypothetical protein
MAEHSSCGDGPELPLLPGVSVSFRDLPQVVVIGIIPRYPEVCSLPSGDWLTNLFLSQHLHCGMPDAVTSVWWFRRVRRLLSLTCRATYAVALSRPFCLASLRVHSTLPPSMDVKARATGICAVYTVLREQSRSRPLTLTLADLGFFLQLRSQAGGTSGINPRALRCYSNLNLRRYAAGHIMYRDCIMRGEEHASSLWPDLVSTLLLALEADLIDLVCTAKDADFRWLAMRLLNYLLADSGNVEAVSWIARLNSMIRLLDVPRDAALSVALLDAFCIVCTQWNVLPAGEDEGHLVLGIKGLHDSSPLHRLIKEVDQAQDTDRFCVYSNGVEQCLCGLRDGLHPGYASPDTDFGALKELRERFRVLLDRCRCTDCTGLIQMTMAA